MSAAISRSFSPAVKDDPARLRKCVDGFSLMCQFNSAMKQADNLVLLTPFHSVAEPPIALSQYMDLVDRHTHCGEEAVLAAMIIIGRYCKATRTLPSALCMHRLLLVATRVAVKALHDVFRSNKTYASAGGIQLSELNDLESFLLTAVDYRVVVTHEEIDRLRAAVALAFSMPSHAMFADCVALAIDPTRVDEPLPKSPSASGSGTSAIRALRPESAERLSSMSLRTLEETSNFVPQNSRSDFDDASTVPRSTATSVYAPSTVRSVRSDAFYPVPTEPTTAPPKNGRRRGKNAQSLSAVPNGRPTAVSA